MHAWAVPAAEAEAQPKAEAFTKELKERGAKEWTKEEAAAAMKEK